MTDSLGKDKQRESVGVNTHKCLLNIVYTLKVQYKIPGGWFKKSRFHKNKIDMGLI